ncbi:hypothetical protein STAN_3666 [Streptomyces sp. CBMAI 2042]|uniref:hypothetical protein n=1 Tax=Streptomyces sp. CBMAI 2042 TaxID=2305222 RepID=UPI000F2C2158|nr:hypothetical protein [Streptomyces sp. CBMAI 2042]RLV68142.1 hypothetical protein STAN_3666 [Streptomyces sp. CBMAI 2042]
MTFPESTTAVVHLDLRTGAAALTTAQAVRDRVAEQLGRAGLPEPDHPLLLVTDTPAGLTGHQLQYELLSNYRAVGDTRILVLLVGSSPGSYAGGEEAYGPDRRLVRPATLRASTIGLVWAGDLRSARTALERPEPDDPASLAVLVDLLSVPDVFVRVLEDLGGLPDSVAAPGVQLLEQDLPPEVRDRAWRDALSRFAGEDGGGASPVTLPPAARLPEPLGALVSGREGRPHGHRQPNGPADLAHRTCAESLDRVDDDLVALRALPGLLSPARREALESNLDQARGHLDEFRALVERALQGSGSGSGAAAEAAARLGALGLRVPPAESAGERVGEGLRELARTLLDEGLALRSVAQHFTALAGRVEPVPGTALLHRLDDHSEEAVHRGSATEYAAPPRTPAPPLVLAGAAGALGGLWQVALLPLALVVPVVFVAVAMWGARRLRTGRRTARWTVGPRVAAVAGAVAGAAAAYATAPPAWLGVTGLLAGLGLTAEAVRRLWRSMATSWAAGRGTTALRTALDGLDALLAELVREHWAAEERLYCADAARSVAGMLRATAAAADAQAVPEPTAPAGASASGPYGDEDWLSAPSALEDPGAETAHDGADDGDWAAAYTWESGPSGDRDDPYAAPAPDNPYATSAPDNPYATPAPDDPFATPAPKAASADAAPWEDTGTRTPRWLDREIGEGGPDLVATLAGDLRATVMVAMKPYWGAVERGQAGALAVRRTEERVRDVLSDARHHLWHNGVLAPPRHPAEHRARTSAAGLLGTDSLKVAELMGRDTDGQAVVQLSSPEQGSLLSRDPEAARWIPFAPRTLQGEVETAWHKSGSPPPDGALWTSSGRYAGLIRLTPLRMGVVDTVLPRQSRGGSTRPDHTDHTDGARGTYSSAGTETGGDEGW